MKALLSILGLLGVLLLGCGPGGPSRYNISGTATCNDKPIPIGALIFNADNKADNKGPQGRADIRNGKITMQSGMGCVGGPQWVQISGFNGVAYEGPEGKIDLGKPLFQMAYKQIELPRSSAEIAIRVVSKGSEAEPDLHIDVVP